MDNRVILLVDDDFALIRNYHIWMRCLSRTYRDVYHGSSLHHLYDIRAYGIADLDDVLDSILKSLPTTILDLVITDFDLISGTGNDVARIVRSKFLSVKIVGNTGGDPKLFDFRLVDTVIGKIFDRNTFYKVIKDNTRLVVDTGIDFFIRAI